MLKELERSLTESELDQIGVELDRLGDDDDQDLRRQLLNRQELLIRDLNKLNLELSAKVKKIRKKVFLDY